MEIVMESFLIVNGLGTKFWRNSDNKLHREDGPAIEYSSGAKEWWINGKYHREDGPAYESSNGYKEWWINGVSLSEQQFNEWRMANKPLIYVDMAIRVRRRVFSTADMW
jgi:hypothetical protein